MARRLSRISFYVIVIIVGFWLILSMMEVKKVGVTPSSELLSFSVDHSTTELHRYRHTAINYERRADELRQRGNLRANQLYRQAHNHYVKAGRFAVRRPVDGHLQRSLARSIDRVESRIKSTQTAP